MIVFSPKALYSYQDLEKIFMIKHFTSAKLVRQGRLTPLVIGHRYYFRGADIRRFIDTVEPRLQVGAIAKNILN